MSAIDQSATDQAAPQPAAHPEAGLPAVVTETPLDAAALEDAVVSARCGAALTFTGVVRDHDPQAEGTVTSLDYSAHPDAERILGEIVARHARGPEDPAGEVRIAAAHRIGHLEVGDLALVVAVASAHRAEAFEACRAVVEQIKAEVPIWKRQHTAAGHAHWVGLP